MIGLVTVTAAGKEAAERLAAAWPGRTRHYHGPAARALPKAYAECDAIVSFLATGATVRLLAPTLAGHAGTGGKASDPGVVCVDQARRYAVALLGGHAGGANRLAREVADVLGAEPVVTTATDAAGIPGLDDLGLPHRGDVAAVARAILDGEPVRLVTERPWPLPAFPPNVRPENVGGPSVVVTDRAAPAGPGVVVLHPPTLVLGVGASRDAPAAELAALVTRALAEAGLAEEAVATVATIDLKADEPAVLALAERMRVPLRTAPADELATQVVPNPSETVREAVGTPSVAEAAVLAVGAELIVEKRASPSATVAIGRLPARGRLAIVGIGPGARDTMTPRAVAELRAASDVVGLDQYVAQVTDVLRPGTAVHVTGMGQERPRVAAAIALARAGRAVALLGSGDAGVYAMASPVLESLAEELARAADPGLATGDPGFEIVGVPGVTAALAAAALLGAPLGNDHAYISLSDLHTPWETIERRLVAAAEGDFTVALYNPRSRGRSGHLSRALEILGAARPATTPVGVVRNADRPGQRIEISTIADLDVTAVDMLSVVIVGAADTRIIAGRMVTPRGYRWMS